MVVGHRMAEVAVNAALQRLIPKSGDRFSDKIMRR
jgi:hypothetical protein